MKLVHGSDDFFQFLQGLLLFLDWCFGGDVLGGDTLGDLVLDLQGEELFCFAGVTVIVDVINQCC